MEEIDLETRNQLIELLSSDDTEVVSLALSLIETLPEYETIKNSPVYVAVGGRLIDLEETLYHIRRCINDSYQHSLKNIVGAFVYWLKTQTISGFEYLNDNDKVLFKNRSISNY